MDIANRYILIIDDSTTNQVLLEALLQEEGFATQSASSVDEAYSIIQKSKPSLILLDLLMPHVSGTECLKHLKSNAGTVNIPVVVVSAVISPEYRNNIMQLGANDYFTKPIDIPVFIRKVKGMLDTKS
ncbi:MAG: PleD family two-component system response regulator [Bacteroidales bacterium]